ncbi:MAG: HAMP domain-containing sensor histidine kinase [Myxococcota bacterium]
MRTALAPLSAAADALERVQGLGSRARLAQGGPVEVDQLLAAANALLDRLDAAFDAQATFTAQAAHELRTPLTVLRGELDLALRRDRDAADYRASLDRVRGEAGRLAELVEGLMLLARVEAGHADRGRAVEQVSEAVHRAVLRERPALDRAGCALQVDLQGGGPASMHLALVTAAVANLLANAAAYAPGAPVAVWLRREGDAVSVGVDDGGPGLPPDERARVLERFQRGASRRDGLGLGLTLAREIARRHGGELALDRSPLGGLRAVLVLPGA